MAKVTRFGDWDKARRLSKNLKNEIVEANKVALRQVGLKTERMVVKYIQSQPSIWHPLNETYLRRKERQGFSNLMLRKTGSYINKITSHVIDANSLVFVGLKSGTVSKEGEDLVTIGHVMEYGSEKRNVKARPHSGPVQKLMSRKIREEQLFTFYLNQQLKRRYGLK